MLDAKEHRLARLVILENDAIKLIVHQNKSRNARFSANRLGGGASSANTEAASNFLRKIRKLRSISAQSFLPSEVFWSLYSSMTANFVMATIKPISKSSKNAESGFTTSRRTAIRNEHTFYSGETVRLSFGGPSQEFFRIRGLLLFRYGSSGRWDVHSSCVLSLQNCKIDWVAVGTWVLALATWALYWATRRLVTTTQTAMAQQATDALAAMERQSTDTRIDLSVRLHMMMEEKWDGERMAIQRTRLARQLLNKADHDAVPEAIMEFFESLSILDRLGLVHPELTWNTFGYHASRWWTACRSYILEERKKQREYGVPQSFTEFQALADRFYERDAKEQHTTRTALEPGSEDVEQFLREESALRTGEGD
jgi:hypothetical protein